MTVFQSTPVYASLCAMIAMVVLRRLLFAFALLGIMFGPVSVSAAASAMALSSDMQMASMPGMDDVDDMSGCPEEQQAQKDCGKTCPLALICSSTILADENRADGWRMRLATRSLSHGFLQEAHLPSATVEPPPRPPRA
ncbi:hypothetical protein [Sinorhizobium glycinis]|uniref:hypothetical protein n=1 Tax=Sinorhizobium glycinis TaxID=1472378 RepID=UPI001FCE2808|nr:hypothetical protein [Sinorhizobium glycinis]